MTPEQDKQEAELAKRRAALSSAMKQIDWGNMEVLVSSQARAAQMKYIAAIRSGFTESQALELCVKGWSL